MKRKLIALLLFLAMLAADFSYAFADEMGTAEVTAAETEAESTVEEAEPEEVASEEALSEEEEELVSEQETTTEDQVVAIAETGSEELTEEYTEKEEITETVMASEDPTVEEVKPETAMPAEEDFEATADTAEEQPEKVKAELTVPETEIEKTPVSRNTKSETPMREDGRTVIDSGTCGDDLTWTMYEDGELIISGTGDMYDYSIDWGEKASYEYAPWYGDCGLIKKVSIVAGVTSIGNGAFNWCKKLTEVTIPNSVISIGEGAFYECSSLADLCIPEGVLSIGSYAFYNCGSLTSIVIPESVTSLGSYAFFDCDNLREATLLNEKTTIGNYALFFIYGDWDKEICDGATLYGYSKSTAEEYATRNNIKFVIYCEHKNTHEVSAIEPTCNSWGYTAGVYCDDCGRYVSGHEWVDKLSHTDENEDGICDTCGNKAAKPIELGFCGDDLLWEMFADGELVISGTGKMYDYSYPDEGEKKATEPSPWCNSYRDDIQMLSIEEGVTSIGTYAFYECRNLKDVYLPESLTSIGFSAFDYCYKLGGLVIPDAVAEIGANAFFYCSSLTRVTIPGGVTELKNYTFGWCEGLNRVDIINDSILIEEDAFRYSRPTLYGHKDSATQRFADDNGYSFVKLCRHINTIEKTVEEPSCGSYGYTAGVYCNDCGEYISGHKRIDKLPHKDEDGNGVCDVCKRSLEVVSSGKCGKNITWTLYKDGYLALNGSGAMTDYSQGKTPWNSKKATITTVELSEGITDICHYAFQGCENLKKVILSEGLEEIEDSAFERCINLTEVLLPDSLKTIGQDVFQNCTHLKDMVLPEWLRYIESAAFSNCSQLQSINIPRRIKVINPYTFRECTSLTEVVIPEGVYEICWSAFSGCSKLSKIIFLDKYEIEDEEFGVGCGIDDTAFEDCSSSLVVYGYEGTDIEYFAECNAFTFKPLPAITTQPKSTAVGNGKKATLSVKAYGLDDPQYQWYFRPGADDDWQPVGEESGTTATYSFTAAAEQDGYQYRCKVFNEERTLTSNAATLTVVTAKPTIKTQPKDTAVASTKKATFTIAATGKALSYQWYYRTSSTASWKKLTASSAKTATYSVTAESGKHGYQYYCAVTNPMGTVKSNTVTLTVVTAKPTIKTQPKAQTVKTGTKVTFKVVASGRALSYQWWYRTSSSGTWKKITSGTKASYSVTTAKKHNGYQYKCVVSNAKGSVTSKIVTLTVVAAKPTIKTQPTSQTVKSGAKAMFKVVASGTALSYQWSYRTSSTGTWKKITTAAGKKAAYTFTTAKKQNGYQYKCDVTNLMGTVTTKTVKLSVK